jgi:hypothetical protein
LLGRTRTITWKITQTLLEVKVPHKNLKHRAATLKCLNLSIPPSRKLTLTLLSPSANGLLVVLKSDRGVRRRVFFTEKRMGCNKTMPRFSMRQIYFNPAKLKQQELTVPFEPRLPGGEYQDCRIS